jgi:hypothetical protein
VTSFANGTTNYTDDTPELDLLEQPVLFSTDEVGNEFGVIGNDVPPVKARLPIQHRGRLYLTDGSTLYWSKNLTELTTDTGFICGKWEEAWSPLNRVDVSKGPEKIVALLSDGVNLYVGSQYSVRRMEGDPPFLFPPAVVHNNTGIVSQDAVQLVFNENTPVGAMWLTPDNRVIFSDFNTQLDVGNPIQTTLNTITNASQANSHAAFYSNGQLDLYILAIPTDGSTNCNTVCVFNLRTRKWVIWALTDTLVAMLFTILDNGSAQFLLSSEGGYIYKLNEDDTQDRVGNTPVDFTVTIRTSWLDLEDPTLRKWLNECEVLTEDAELAVTVEGASKQADFSTPHTVVSNLVVVPSPLGEYKAYLSGYTSRDRYYRFTFVSDNEVVNVLDGYNIEALPVNRQ